MNVHDHVTGVISYGGIRMAGNIPEKAINVEYSVGGWFCLHRAEYTKGDMYGEVDGSGIVEEGAYDLLDGGGLLWG